MKNDKAKLSSLLNMLTETYLDELCVALPNNIYVMM